MAILFLGNIEFTPLEDEMSKLVADQGKKKHLKGPSYNDIIQLMYYFEVNIRICQPGKVMST